MFDWGWLGGLFNSFLGLFDPLKKISHWRIWSALFDVWKHLKAWRDWYRKHVLAQMNAIRHLQQQIFNTFFKPVLSIIDTVRRLSGIVGIFNRGLANRLNLMFFRVESYLLLPMNLLIRRINSFFSIFTAFLTPLGYLDRATMLNSIWRDFGILKKLLYNPFGSTILGGGLGTPPPFSQLVSDFTDYVQGNPSPIKQSNDALFQDFLGFIGQGQ